MFPLPPMEKGTNGVVHDVKVDCERRRVPPTHRTIGRYSCYVLGGQAQCFAPNRVRFQMAWIVDGLAR